MKRFTRAMLLSTALTAMTAASPALAQVSTAAASGAPASVEQQDPAAPEGNDDIVVTAQKREQRLLDVPVAITAISAEALTTQNFNRVSDYFDRVPGLQFSGQRVSGLSLRGITTGGATSPTVAILVDDVQFGGTTNAGQPPIPDFDASALSRIEVLRGPQGTLYGAASLGGLIKYVLREPDTRELSGRLELGGTAVDGGGTGWAARGSINIPITDTLAVSGSGFYRDDAAYLRNVHPLTKSAKNVNTREAWGFRGAALFKPTDSFSILVSALNQKQDAVNSDLAITSGGVPICKACSLGAAGAASAPTTYEPVYGDLTLRALDSYNNSKYQLYSAKAQLDLGGVKLTSISAWSRADNIISNDVTSVFLRLFQLPFSYGTTVAPAGSSVTIGNADHTHKFSQELRLSAQGPVVDWLVGGFYTIENASTDQTLLLYNPSGSLIATPYAAKGPGSYREYAGFADATLHATDKLDIQVGGRYASNKQRSSIVYNNDGPAIPLFGANVTQTAASKDHAFTWLVSPSYRLGKDMLAYVRVASGYRPGGPNLESPTHPTFGPDRVVNYEVGFKGHVVPGLLTIDTALFQINWKDIQIQGTSPSQMTFLTNGGKARSRGWEFAATLTPWHGMTVDGNFTVTDTKLTQKLPSLTDGLVGNAGDRLPYSAKFTTTIGADQRFDLSDRLQASAGGTFTHIGDRAGQFVSINGSGPRMLIPGYSVVDLRAGLIYDKDWSLTLYIRNVGDERGVTVAQNRNGTSVPTALFILPRTFGMTVARNF